MQHVDCHNLEWAHPKMKYCWGLHPGGVASWFTRVLHDRKNLLLCKIGKSGMWFCWPKAGVVGKARLQGKFVDVNREDLEKPVIRSRYVAKESANTRTDDFF